MFYLAQVIVYTALMYLVYLLFLRNRPMHAFNRAYLLATVVLPLVLPFISLSPRAVAPLRQATLQGIRLPEITVAKDVQPTVTNLAGIATAIYLLVAAGMLLLKIRQWYKLKQVIANNEKIPGQDYTLVINSGYGPGSWGKYIFIPAEETNDTIIDHEQAHIQLCHTADVMLLDVLQVFFWPNLLLVWLRRELVQVHEFQADAIAGTEKYTYAQLLVSNLFHTCTLPSSHSFIIHPIKRRIKMLNKKKTLVPRITALLATGVVTTLLLVNIVAIQSCNTKKWDAKSDDGKKGVPGYANVGNVTYYTQNGKYVDFKEDVHMMAHKMPKFNGDMMKFMGENMKYPKEAIDRKIEGKVFIQFVVDRDGSIVNTSVLKSPDTLLSAAALQVVNTMPAWLPGENEAGEKVPVMFTLPVSFKL